MFEEYFYYEKVYDETSFSSITVNTKRMHHLRVSSYGWCLAQI
ncbi:MAG: hypothetical protein ACLRI8_04590 [Agathobacter rectalis]